MKPSRTQGVFEFFCRFRKTATKPSLVQGLDECISSLESLGKVAEAYHEHRRTVMESQQEGLTKTYNCFHDPDKSSSCIQKLRDLHVEMDQAVAAAYDWDDLDLGHDFHETKLGVRYTISEPARREILQRLLKLNHERYEEEVAEGLHDKKKRGKKKSAPKKKTPANKSLTLFDMGGDN